MGKPLIGIVPLIDTQKESYWMLPGYMEGIRHAGGLPVMLPLTQDPEEICQFATACDGFIFTGGHDISPALYGMENDGLCGEIIPGRDEMEVLLLREVLKLDKPALGICRGLQMINAVLGGTLHRDIPQQFPSAVNHRQPAPYHLPIHEVAIHGSLAQVLGTDAIMVNSCHHQGIKELAPCLSSMAEAPDGLVEAVTMPGKRFLWAVQWHPEFMQHVDENSQKIFRAFVSAAAEES